MKKKILGLLFAVVLLFGATACGDKKESKKSKGKIEYNAVYKLKNDKIKTYKFNDTIYYKIEGSSIENNGTAELKKNTIKLDVLSDDAKLTFKNDGAVLKTSNKYIKSGTYKKTSKYEKEAFYNDFYGEKEYLDSEINGLYVKDDIKIYAYQRNSEEIRVYYKLNDMDHDLTLAIDEDGDYYLEFFEDIYVISFYENSMAIELQTGDESYQIISGTYTKDSSIGLDEIMSTYTPY